MHIVIDDADDHSTTSFGRVYPDGNIFAIRKPITLVIDRCSRHYAEKQNYHS